ncbi:preprotein translocase subunit YajC [Nocardioides aromaticivorans]|uniref:Preprotein translocase subunit YajC n=1 Tax=Nocardioides aromaticivorans TaxID=200618 RepID=A0ABX7PL69_9ACTN|nr:preprotein translocase subunit YajC [Nocardioides aromaticivorans]
MPPLRRGTGGRLHARGRRRRGAGDRRGGRRAVPRAQRLPRPHPTGPDRHAGGLGAPRDAGAVVPDGRGDADPLRGLTPPIPRRLGSVATLPCRPAPASQERCSSLPRWRGSSVKDAAQLLPIVAIAVIFWLLIIRPASRQRKQAAELQSQLSVGDDVMLTSGIFGTIVDTTGDNLELEIAPGVVVEVVRGAVASVRRDLAEAPAADAPDDDSTDPEEER